MKKLFMVLAVASMFIASTALAATLTMTMPTNNAQAGPPVTAQYNFTVDTDGAGNITAWTDLLSNYFFAASQQVIPNAGTFPVGSGGYDPRDGGMFAPGEAIFPSGVKQYVSLAFDGNTAGTTLWFKGQSNVSGKFGGMVFNVGLLQLTYNAVTEQGQMAFGPSMALAENYNFQLAAVPIPGAAWLLLSGLVGIIGLRRRS